MSVSFHIDKVYNVIVVFAVGILALISEEQSQIPP